MAKIDRLPLRFALLPTTEWYIVPGVFEELQHSLNLGRQYARDVLALLKTGQIRIAYMTQDEVALQASLPHTLGEGERQSIAVAGERGGTVLSNESRVAHWCRQYGIACLRLPDILRALWLEGIVPKVEVRQMISDLQAKDRMQFKASIVDAIFGD